MNCTTIVGFKSNDLRGSDKKAAASTVNRKDLADELSLKRPGDDFSRLTLMRLTKENVKGFISVSADYERLVVITGGFVQSAGKVVDLPNFPPTLNQDMERYHEKLKKMAKNNNSLVMNNESSFFSQNIITNAASSTKGVLPYRNNGESSAATLHKNSFTNEFISTDMSNAIFEDLCSAGIIANGVVKEKSLANFDLLSLLGYIFSNDEKQQRVKNDISNQILEVQRILLENIGAVYFFTKAANATVIPVVNQPGKFIFDCGDEAFLLYPTYQNEEKNVVPLDFQKMDAGVTIGTMVTAWTFKQIGFEDAIAGLIFDALKLKKEELNSKKSLNRDCVIGVNNIVNRELCTMEKLKNLTHLTNILTTHYSNPKTIESKRELIYVRLLNLPLLSVETFQGIAGIREQAGGKNPIIQVLLEYHVLYLNPIATDSYYFDFREMGVASNIVFVNDSGGLLPPKSVEQIYERLMAAVSSVGFYYRSKPLPREFPKDYYFKGWQFAVQRLTNPTIKKLKRKLEMGGNFFVSKTRNTKSAKTGSRDDAIRAFWSNCQCDCTPSR
jgi:hypothetical protein